MIATDKGGVAGWGIADGGAAEGEDSASGGEQAQVNQAAVDGDDRAGGRGGGRGERLGRAGGNREGHGRESDEGRLDGEIGRRGRRGYEEVFAGMVGLVLLGEGDEAVDIGVGVI